MDFSEYSVFNYKLRWHTDFCPGRGQDASETPPGMSPSRPRHDRPGKGTPADPHYLILTHVCTSKVKSVCCSVYSRQRGRYKRICLAATGGAKARRAGAECLSYRHTARPSPNLPSGELAVGRSTQSRGRGDRTHSNTGYNYSRVILVKRLVRSTVGLGGGCSGVRGGRLAELVLYTPVPSAFQTVTPPT